MNRRVSIPYRRSYIPRIKVLFDLRDEAERRAVDWIAAFHEPGGIYNLVDVRRGLSTEGARMVWILTRSQVARANARPKWLIIEYALDEVRVCMKPYHTLRAGRAAFEEAATGPN